MHRNTAPGCQHAETQRGKQTKKTGSKHTARAGTPHVLHTLELKQALSVRFLRMKAIRSKPSHSSKSTGGGGFRGSMRTTLDSTFGGGRKLFLPTCMQRFRGKEWLSCQARAANPDQRSRGKAGSASGGHSGSNNPRSTADTRYRSSTVSLPAVECQGEGFLTFIKWETRDNNCVLTDKRQ